MQDYSLDLAAERINHTKTKEYFREVMSSYANGNYRSAVLSLYAVVISDLVYKLKDQVEREDDPGAKKILEDVQKEKDKDITSSKWEMTIVDRVFAETKLLEISDRHNIDSLKGHRNLSAHPNILDTEDNVLFTPNKDTVRAHIRNMLEGVLTKSTVHTAKLVDTIIEKIPQIYEDLDLDDDMFNRAFKNKYLDHMNEKAITSLFKKLWKFTYLLENKECDENRDVNALTVELIFRLYPDLVIKCLTDDQAYYSRVSFNKNPISKMINFFNLSPRLFKLIENDMRNKIEAKIIITHARYVRAYFLSSSPEDHLMKVKDYLKSQNFNFIALYRFKDLAKNINRIDEYHNMLITYFSKATNYSDTYSRFNKVEKNLNEFTHEQLNNLLEVMNSNNQIYDANGISDMVDVIQEIAEDKFGSKIDLAPYPNLL